MKFAITENDVVLRRDPNTLIVEMFSKKKGEWIVYPDDPNGDIRYSMEAAWYGAQPISEEKALQLTTGAKAESEKKLT